MGGTSNGVWAKCAKTRSGQVLSTRVKTETICDHGEFYKLPRSAVKICTKKNTRLALTQAQMATGNLNAEYVRPGSNPSKIVMKYHQTKVCRGNRQIADYTRTMLRSDRAGLTEAP